MYTPNNYSNGFYNVGPYTPQQSLTTPNFGNQTVTQQPQNTFAWIQGGSETASNYPVAPGNTVVLIDSDNPILFIKSSDLSGRPQPMQTRYMVTKEDYEKIQNGNNNLQNSSNYITKDEFNRALQELDNRFVIRKGDRK